MQLSDFKVLTFDTYGTLIDWESGIFTALSPLIGAMAEPLGRDQTLETFAKFESAQQAATPALKYSGLLSVVYRQLAANWKLETSNEDAVRFGQSVKDWPAFPDAVEALAYLKQHFTMITLTNCDRTSYRGSDARLDAPWHAIYTAEDAGSYKPSQGNFDYLFEHVQQDFGYGPPDILHTAQSLFHDHVPATARGLATAWIDRRHDTLGYGATMPPPGDYRIDFHFNSMAEMVSAHRAELAF